MPSVMLRPRPISAYSAMSAMTAGMKPVKPSGRSSTMMSRTAPNGTIRRLSWRVSAGSARHFSAGLNTTQKA